MSTDRREQDAQEDRERAERALKFVGDPAEGPAPMMLIALGEGDTVLVPQPDGVDRTAFPKLLEPLGDKLVAWIDAATVLDTSAVLSFADYVAESTDPEDVPELHTHTCDMLGYDPDNLPAYFDEEDHREERPVCTCGVTASVRALRAHVDAIAVVDAT